MEDEGSGVVLAVVPGVRAVAPGDSVVASFLPACGTCRWCASGRSDLCDLGATIATGQLPTGTWPFRLDGAPLGGVCMVGAFARHPLLSEASCTRIDPWVPLDTAALLACSVPTGRGSAVYAGGTRPGDTVVVVGCDGVGANAVQGAVHARASHVIAIAPGRVRREFAQSVGATHAVQDTRAAAGLARELTRGNGADVVVPMLIRLAAEGRLELDRLVTRRYSLDQLGQGFADQAAGETIRGLLVHVD